MNKTGGNMPDVVFENPPGVIGRDSDSRNGIWQERLRPLMQRPGEWARVFEGSQRSARNATSGLKAGKIGVLPGKWEFTSRTINDRGFARVYARYLGENGSDPA